MTTELKPLRRKEEVFEIRPCHFKAHFPLVLWIQTMNRFKHTANSHCYPFNNWLLYSVSLLNISERYSVHYQVSWNVSYLGINLLGVNIFMSFVIHSTLILRNLYSLLRNLSHNESLSNSFFFSFIFFSHLVLLRGEVFLSLREGQRRRRFESNGDSFGSEHVFVTEESFSETVPLQDKEFICRGAYVCREAGRRKQRRRKKKRLSSVGQ